MKLIRYNARERENKENIERCLAWRVSVCYFIEAWDENSIHSRTNGHVNVQFANLAICVQHLSSIQLKAFKAHHIMKLPLNKNVRKKVVKQKRRKTILYDYYNTNERSEICWNERIENEVKRSKAMVKSTCHFECEGFACSFHSIGTQTNSLTQLNQEKNKAKANTYQCNGDSKIHDFIQCCRCILDFYSPSSGILSQHSL